MPRKRELSAAGLELRSRLQASARPWEIAGLLETLGRSCEQALRILRPNVFQMGSGRIWAAFASAESPRAKLAYLQLLASFSKWESLAHLLRASAEADPEVSEAGRLHLRRWLQNFNRSFTNPAPDQLQSIRTAMADSGGRLAS